MTFGSVSDWSEEQEKNLEQAVLLDSTPATETDDDEGKPCQLHSAIQSCDYQVILDALKNLQLNNSSHIASTHKIHCFYVLSIFFVYNGFL